VRRITYLRIGSSTSLFLINRCADIPNVFFEVNGRAKWSSLGVKMQKQDVFYFVRDSVADLLVVPSEKIAGSTDLFSLGLDSLVVIQLLHRLEEKFGLRIELGDFYISPCVDKSCCTGQNVLNVKTKHSHRISHSPIQISVFKE
jgi:acyl carrier protein